MTDLQNTEIVEPRRRRRSKSRKRGPLLSAIWFAFLGVNWTAIVILLLIYFRPHPLRPTDYAVGGIGVLLGLFYVWVGYCVYRRRKFILDAAFALAGFGLFSPPIGTAFSILLLSDLMARKHDFTK